MPEGFIVKVTTRLNDKTHVGFVGEKGKGIVDRQWQAQVFVFSDQAQRAADALKLSGKTQGVPITARVIKAQSGDAWMRDSLQHFGLSL